MSCIDLVISKHAVDVSIFYKCYHNIIYGKINIHITLPSILVRKVWDNTSANVEIIKKVIFNWNKAFENLSIEGKVGLLN